MGNPDPPPDLQSHLHRDEEGILLNPDPSMGEIAVLNPALYRTAEEGPWPFLYRTRRQNPEGREYSTIDFRLLETPRRLSSSFHTLIYPEHDFEAYGVEDPRITQNGQFHITYIAYDGINARPALATTKDFRTLEKHGPIMPNITLEEAIDLVGDRSYQKLWGRLLEIGRRIWISHKRKKINWFLNDYYSYKSIENNKKASY